MSLVVIDASAVVEYLLRTDLGVELRARIEAPAADLHAPALCDVEVASALRRAMADRRATERRAREALADYLDLPLTRHGHATLMSRMLELRANFTASDATYAALAERLGASLLTADRALARAATEHLALEVEGPFGSDRR
ncbi:MAG: type II toxin-antitoxin system VapC family toxin [Gemmatimonadales bacterium]